VELKNVRKMFYFDLFVLYCCL